MGLGLLIIEADCAFKAAEMMGLLQILLELFFFSWGGKGVMSHICDSHRSYCLKSLSVVPVFELHRGFFCVSPDDLGLLRCQLFQVQAYPGSSTVRMDPSLIQFSALSCEVGSTTAPLLQMKHEVPKAVAKGTCS